MTVIFAFIKNVVFLWVIVRSLQGFYYLLRDVSKLVYTTFIKKEYHS